MIAELDPEERLVIGRMLMESTSGPLPDAVELYKYTPEHQERIFRVSESYTSDESTRRSELQAAQIKQSERAQWITPALFVLFGGVATYFYSVGNSLAGTAFLAVPVLRFLGTFAAAYTLRRQRAADEDDD
ncbi:hypothetical protein [Agrococcus sp. ProA11]|uniref:hypothetical protein n=1 Tax=Agrococcus chionoecetis TaxID=3153752 RepID=UPI0032603F79